MASSAYCCCTCSENCVNDDIKTIYFDRQPMRTGTCCYFIPTVCCGAPIIYSKEPRCCCGLISLSSCCGTDIKSAPCTCFHLKSCICIGTPCYESYSSILIPGLTNDGAKRFTTSFQKAMNEYQEKHTDIGSAELAVFRDIGEGWLNDKTKKSGPSTE
eukprot:SAG31_NODE_145_length_22612_cov_5.938169_2_plen_158_part_00